MSIMIFYSTSKSFFFHHGRKFFSQTGVPGPANARSPLHYVPFRLAFGNPSIPAQVLSPRKPRTCFFRSLHSRWLQPTFAFRGCSLRFSPVRVPAQVSKPRKPRTCSFRFLLFPSVWTDVRFPWVLSQVFTCSGTRANSITALNRALVLFALFIPVGYNRRSLYAGALTGFHLFGYPRQFYYRAKPPTSQCKL